MQLSSLLEKMKMEYLGAQLDAICEQAAKRDLGYREFLTEALEAEWRGRYQRAVESRLNMARFPWIKTLEQFDFSFQPSIDRKVIRELTGLGFVDRAENVIILGHPGVGKTHLAIALGVKGVLLNVLMINTDHFYCIGQEKCDNIIKTGRKSKGKRQITGQEDPCVVRDDIPGTAAISSKSSLGVPLWPEGHREVHMDQVDFPRCLIRRSFVTGHIQILLC